jgi:hypothetical protein
MNPKIRLSIDPIAIAKNKRSAAYRLRTPLRGNAQW